MQRRVLLSKIHRATVTGACVDYEGSITIPPELLGESDIHPYEAVWVWNVTRGTRFETYAISGEEDSNDICVNGAAAHLVEIGDKVIIACFGFIAEVEIKQHQPRLVFVDGDNRSTGSRSEMAGPLEFDRLS